ncbi:hypothetical protein GC170_19980 [bacterium]|nr:hypothetical protein [bacterium]
MNRFECPTDAGMHCLWNEAAFEGVSDYDSWEKELLNDADIRRHIAAGHFVPLNIGSDGVMSIEIRRGTSETPAALNEREERYVIVASEPYLLRSTGRIGVSGIEHIEVPAGEIVGLLDLPAGDYAVRVHLIGWDEEPGMSTDDGPAPDALADYVVLIDPATGDEPFRTELETFPSPS